MKKIIIIDSNALIHRAFHALPDSLRTADGRPTNAIYGFLLIFLNIIEKFQPEYVVATFDRGGKTFRHKIFEGYKSKRVKAPPELYQQISFVKKFLKILGIPSFSFKGIEADDIIGTLAQKTEGEKDLETIILTGDQDTLQLVSSRVRVYAARKGTKDMVLYGPEEVLAKIGVGPLKIVDYKALAGDPSDNIPGAVGIGSKTAVSLLTQYENLAAIYDNLKEIKAPLREKLLKNKEQVFLSRELACIKRKIPLSFQLEEAKFKPYDKKKLAAFLKDFEFSTLLKRLDLETSLSGKDLRDKEKGKENSLFAFSIKKITPAACLEKLGKEKSERKICITIFEKPLPPIMEKTVLNCNLKKIVFSFLDKTEVFIVSLEGVPKETRGKIIKALNKRKLIFWDGKVENEILAQNGLIYFKLAEDFRSIAYLLGWGEAKFDLSFLEKRFRLQPESLKKLQEYSRGQTKLIFDEAEKKQGEELWENYLGERIAVTKKIFLLTKKELKNISQRQKEKGVTPAFGNLNIAPPFFSRGIRDVYKKIELPLTAVLLKMEARGVLLDKRKIFQLKKEYQKEADFLKAKIFKFCKSKFNLDSSLQLSTIFYGKLGFSTQGIKKGKSGYYSTSADALEILAKKYPLAESVKKYRELTKLINTYLEPLPGLINPQTGRIHTQFNQEVTTTGRLSSSNPNLQNIPIRTEWGARIRGAFRAKQGSVFLSADYSQIELRVAAFYSGDRTMQAIFSNSGDIHLQTAAKVHGIKESAVTAEIRRTAKELNFGIIYGMGTYGFARSAGISRQEATEFMKKYREQFPEVFDYLKKARETAQKEGYVETIFGRRRYLPEIFSRNWQIRASGERMAVNMPLQGTAADIMKLALIKIDQYLEKKKLASKIRILLTVHDEILFEVDKNKIACAKKIIPRLMEEVVSLKVPLKVDLKWGKNWQELKAL